MISLTNHDTIIHDYPITYTDTHVALIFPLISRPAKAGPAQNVAVVAARQRAVHGRWAKGRGGRPGDLTSKFATIQPGPGDGDWLLIVNQWLLMVLMGKMVVNYQQMIG